MTFQLPTSGGNPSVASKEDLEQEANAELALKADQAALDAEAVTRANDDTVITQAVALLRSDLTAETGSRTAGDAQLAISLGTLIHNLDDEIAVRAQADTDLALSTGQLETALAALTAALADEIAARVAADTGLSTGTVFAGGWDASTGAFPALRAASAGGGAVRAGDYFEVTVAGTVDGQDYAAREIIRAFADDPSTADSDDWFRGDVDAALGPIYASGAVDYANRRFGSVSEFLASARFTYANVAVDAVMTEDETGLKWKVAPVGVLDEHVTVNGVKYYVQPIGGRYDLAAFGCALHDPAVNDDDAWARVLAAHDALGGVLRHSGGTLTLASTSVEDALQPGLVRMEGVGYQAEGRPAFGSANYSDPAFLSGSLIRITGTAAAGLFLGKTVPGNDLSKFSYGGFIRDVGIIGPGQGTETAVILKQIVGWRFENVAFINLPIATDWQFLNSCKFVDCEFWGNLVALNVNDPGNNTNVVDNADLVKNEVDFHIKDAKNLTLRDVTFQDAASDHVILDTIEGGRVEHVTVDDCYFEGDGNGVTVEMTGSIVEMRGGDYIANIRFTNNTLASNGPIILLPGNGNRGHVFSGNDNETTTIGAQTITIPAGSVGFTARDNIGIDVVDESHTANITDSGTQTLNFEGFTTPLSRDVDWVRDGRAVYFNMPSATGTSNLEDLTITGFSTNMTPSVDTEWAAIRTVDDGGPAEWGMMAILADGTADVRSGPAGGKFAVTGQKGVQGTRVSYLT